jgi:putative ATP-dependent endonuclease of OLD family
MGIPCVIITDGDFYYLNDDDTREYHCLQIKEDLRKIGFLGVENIKNIAQEVGIKFDKNITNEDFKDEMERYGFFIGKYTLEVDIMLHSRAITQAVQSIINSYNAICNGGKRQQENFASELGAGEVFKCLNKIESNGIGKGRFAQRFSNECVKENIPQYIQKAIEYITTINTKA